MTTGCVFNIQRFSTDDGSGIRTCVFLKGCPLRCAWCHNAEGLSFSPEIACYERNCIGCGACVATCPQNALAMENGRVAIDRTKCVSCEKCAQVCPTETLVQIGKNMTVDEVMNTVRRDRIFYGENGGMTIMGGEPLAQAKFTLSLAKAAKKEGISVAVETSGYGKIEDLLSLVPFCDLFLFDCKASSNDHKKLTGVSDTLIVKNLDALCQAGASIILRCPMIEGANMNDEFIQRIIWLSKDKTAIQKIQLMPYHTTGLDKSSILGKAPQNRYSTPSEESLLLLAKEIALKSGKNCVF